MRAARGGEHPGRVRGAGGDQAADEAVRPGRQPLRLQRRQVGDRQSQGLKCQFAPLHPCPVSERRYREFLK